MRMYHSAAASAGKYVPTRPGFVRGLSTIGDISKKGKRKRRSLLMVERLIDQSRYPGHVLREIRAGRTVDGHNNQRERARRLTRGCVQ